MRGLDPVCIGSCTMWHAPHLAGLYQLCAIGYSICEGGCTSTGRTSTCCDSRLHPKSTRLRSRCAATAIQKPVHETYCLVLRLMEHAFLEAG